MDNYIYKGSERAFVKLVHRQKQQAEGGTLKIEGLESYIKRRDSIIVYSYEKWVEDGKGNGIIDRVVSFSLPVISSDGLYAVCTMGVTISRLNGYSVIIFLKKDNGQWKVVDSNILNIS